MMIGAWLYLLLRVGGGESYSGGGGGSDGGGGGGGGDGDGELIWLLFRFLFWLTMEYPAIGIPVDIVVIFILIKWWRRKQTSQTLRVSTSTVAQAAPKLDALRRFDPNFSEITFSDFCYSIHARAHHARGKDLQRYAPYLSDAARATLQQRGGDVRAVVIGACNIIAFSGVESTTVTASVMYESNIT